MKVFGALLFSAILALSPLEPPDNSGIYFGSWYDRLHGDTPVATNARVNYKPLSFFQSDVNITSTLQSASLDNFVSQVAATATDAFIYLTVYPMEGKFSFKPQATMPCLIVHSTICAPESTKSLRRGAEC
jgi:hypothetical protein